MIYKGYEIKADEDFVLVSGVTDFDPVHTFECGQCFRWHREEDGSYTGVVMGRVVNVEFRRSIADNTDTAHYNECGSPDGAACCDAASSDTGYCGNACCDAGSSDTGCCGNACCDAAGSLIIRNTNLKDFQDIWFDYFDLGRDYRKVKKAVATDDIMKKAVKFGGGIRILRQDPWETLISFIISANNRIPRIMKIIDDMSRFYGNEIEYNGKLYYSFPDVQSLAACSLEQLQVCRAGYRCGYIHKTAAMIALGDFDIKKLNELETGKAREYLLKLQGVGNKVADCMLLYSGTKFDVFPTDVWVKRVMEELYFKREASFKEIQQFAADKFGYLAGMAQQYLFYYARSTLGR